MPRRLAALAAALLLASSPGQADAPAEFTTLKGHGGPIMGLATSPSGQVASASFDNSIGLWTAPSSDGAKPVWLEAHDAAAVDVIFPSDRLIASGGDDFSVRLWEKTAQGFVPRLLGRHKGKVTDLALSPDGSTLASASWDGSVALWPLAGGAPRLLSGRAGQPDGGVNDVAFSPDGTRLYAATAKGDLLLYRLDGADPPRLLAENGFGINEMVLDPAGAWLVYGTVDGTTWVIDPDSGEKRRSFAAERKPILAMDFNRATGQLAVGFGDGYILTFDTAPNPADWRIAKGFQAMRHGPVWALAWAPDGALIWAGGIDDVIYGWPVALFGRAGPAGSDTRSFLRAAASMPNGERQFMRKCSICHALKPGDSRKAGPSLHGVFGRRAGTLPGYRYSRTLLNADITWTAETINALFDTGPDAYIPRSKMPMQRIVKPEDRADLIDFLKRETR